MASDELFSRDEVLAGMPAQRARSLLFLIESQTGHQMARSRRVVERFLSEEAAEERDLAFLEAFSLGRDPPLKPAVQDLERYASDWAALIPDNPGLRAALAYQLGQKYRLVYRAVPGIRRSLGLDTDAVRKAYRRQFHQPLDGIYVKQPGFWEQARWGWAAIGRRIENLPPFWTAFSVTLTETVGASILALPIALARLGPAAGLVILVAIGLVNVFTIVYVAETLARTGSVRYGNAYFGRLVTEYLGNAGSLVFTAALGILIFLVLIAYYSGIAKTLEDATRVPAPIWAALLFLVSIFFIRRESLNATLATALLVGAVNILLVLVLSALALTEINLEYLSKFRFPGFGGQPFEAAFLELVFGVVLAAYFGHTSIANCAKVVLQRDNSGRSLIAGSMAAQFAAILLYLIWLVSINGSIPAEQLEGQTGTVLIPLAEQGGPLIYIFGSIYVILGMGMASIHYSLGSYNLVRDWLPSTKRRVIRLSRRHGSLVFTLRQGERRQKGIGSENLKGNLYYLGLTAGVPKYRLDVREGERIRRLENSTSGVWDAGVLLRTPYAVSLKITTLDATRENARVQVKTNLAVAYHGDWDTSGLEMGDLLDLPEEQQRLFTWVLRRGEASLSDLAARTGQEESSLLPILEGLVAQGYLQPSGAGKNTRYQALLAVKRPRKLSPQVWQALDGETDAPTPSASRLGGFFHGIADAASSERARSWLGILPLVALLLLVEWLLLSHRESFVAPLNFAGLITVSLLGGTFPVLLLHASRRKGELVPRKVISFAGHPLFTVSIYLLTLGGILLHGLVIWQNPFQRLVALGTGMIMLGVTWKVLRSGAFSPRTVVELRQDPGQSNLAQFSITASGEPLPVQVKLSYQDGDLVKQTPAGEISSFSSLRAAEFELPNHPAHELKVWAHRAIQNGNSESLPVTAQVQCGDEARQSDIILQDGQGLLPLGSGPCRVGIQLVER
jgi:amino acid permease